MNRSLRIATVAALGVAAVMCTGCIKFHTKMTLMPDGSGKVEYTMAANSALFAQLGQGAGSPLDDFTIGDAAESMEGIVAFTKPVEKKANGWDYRTFTAYFDDINKVKFDKEDPDQPTFKHTAEGGKHTLTVSNAPIAKMASDMGGQIGQGGDDPAQQAQMKMMFTGFEVVENYTMPAKITEGAGLKNEGRTGEAKLTADVMFDKEKMAKLAKVTERTIVAEGDPIGDADVAKFKAELAKAKAEWAAMKDAVEAEQKAKKAKEEAEFDVTPDAPDAP